MREKHGATVGGDVFDEVIPLQRGKGARRARGQRE
jgi:hypothetical protein